MFRDPLCVLRCTADILIDLTHVHIDDVHDDKVVAEQKTVRVHKRARRRAANVAKALHKPIILTAPLDNLSEKTIQFPLTPSNVAPTYVSTCAYDENDLFCHKHLFYFL